MLESTYRKSENHPLCSEAIPNLPQTDFLGLVKKSYRHTTVSSLPEIEKMVRNSSVAGKNIPQPTIDSAGKLWVVWCNWSSFLSDQFNTIPGISKYHHFRYASFSPGTSFVKEHPNSLETSTKLKDSQDPIDILKIPDMITPSGISRGIQIYLYEKIRRFCSTKAAADLTCPQPQTEPSSSSITGKPSNSKRKCSHCRQIGHTKTVRGAITYPQLLKND